MNSPRLAVVLAGLAVGAAACGAGGAGTAAPAHVDSNALNAASAVSAASGTVVVKTRKVSPYGTILTTSSGFTLYVFKHDHKGSSSCNGSCADEWPPLIVPKGDKVSGVSGIDTIKRSDGSEQAALRGHALYRFADDKSPGQVKGQFGDSGTWFVETPSGPVTDRVTLTPSPTPKPTKSSPPSGGGYGY